MRWEAPVATGGFAAEELANAPGDDNARLGGGIKTGFAGMLQNLRRLELLHGKTRGVKCAGTPEQKGVAMRGQYAGLRLTNSSPA